MNLLPNLTPKQAVQFQKTLVEKIRFAPLPSPDKGMLVAGADCSYEKRATTGYAAIVVCRWPDLEVVEIGRGVAEVEFPYVPGLLSFREMPLLQHAWANLKIKPAFVVVDGQGIAHPRKMGIATHAGLLWKTPTVGSAKSLLVGEHRTLGEKRGSKATLKHRGEKIGVALRTRENVKPVYVSPGHLCDFDSAVKWIHRLSPRYRIPEVIRMAHREVNRMRIEANPGS